MLTKERWSQLNSVGFDWRKQGEIGRSASSSTTTTTTRTTNDPTISFRATGVAELSSEVFATALRSVPTLKEFTRNPHVPGSMRVALESEYPNIPRRCRTLQ
jgi:hypothetical protein